jgi:hypothetical protein
MTEACVVACLFYLCVSPAIVSREKESNHQFGIFRPEPWSSVRYHTNSITKIVSPLSLTRLLRSEIQ